MDRTSLTRSLHRRALVACTGALALAVVPATPAVGQESPGTPVCDDEDADRFSDVSDDDPHAPNIECAADHDWVTGYEDGTFRPDATVSRAEMASIVAQHLADATGEPLPQGDDAFTDDDRSVHEPNIDRLANAGIVHGYSETSFRPDAAVTRGQLARFVANAIDYVDTEAETTRELPARIDDSIPPETDTASFPDVQDGDVFAESIRELAGQGIVRGKNDGRFHASEPVSRAETTTYVVRAARYLDGLNLFTASFDEPAQQTFTTSLTALNGSGVTGTATAVVGADGNLTVTVEAQGLDDGMHPQHVHGSHDRTVQSTCPDEGSADQRDNSPGYVDNPDEVVSLAEGLDEYQPALIPLDGEEDQTADASSFPVSQDGTITYQQTFTGHTLDVVRPLDELDRLAVVLHGADVDGDGAVDSPGEADSQPENLLPVACGTITSG